MSVTPPVNHSEMWPYVVLSPAHHAVTAVRRVSLVKEKQSAALAAPPVEYGVSAGQASSQLNWPVSSPKKPPGQGMQLVWKPLFGWKLPAVHGKQAAWPSVGLE